MIGKRSVRDGVSDVEQFDDILRAVINVTQVREKARQDPREAHIVAVKWKVAELQIPRNDVDKRSSSHCVGKYHPRQGLDGTDNNTQEVRKEYS